MVNVIDLLKDISLIVGYIGTFVAIAWAVYVYRRNSALERTKWQAQLYEKFFERSDLKEIRELMDSDDEISLEITRLIRDEPSEFTDYLNFFEFVAFLEKSKQLKINEINDFFG